MSSVSIQIPLIKSEIYGCRNTETGIIIHGNDTIREMRARKMLTFFPFGLPNAYYIMRMDERSILTEFSTENGPEVDNSILTVVIN